MTTDAYDITPSHGDALYGQARGHLQAGRFDEAVRCLEDLQRRYPDDASLTRLLDEARFKARLDKGAGVRVRRWIIPWRRIVLSLIIVVGLAFILIQGSVLLNERLAPWYKQAQINGQVAGLLKQGNSYLEAENYDAAQKAFEGILGLEGQAENGDAKAGLAKVKDGREILELYTQAETYYQSGDYPRALELYTELTVRKPGYRDVTIKIAEIKRIGELDALFAGAEADLQAERYAAAVSKLEQIRQLSTSYKAETIADRLFGLYVLQGKAIVDARPPALDQVPQALEFFKKAASLQPNDPQAGLERSLAESYLVGQAAFKEGQWGNAVAALATVYGQRPDYLAGAALQPLYDAYLKNGDYLRGAGDCPGSWEQYNRASQLPADTTMARARMSEVAACMTPTLTPSPTPTSTPVPTIDMTAVIKGLPLPPTPLPTGTPVPPLASFRNQIVYKADRDDGQSGFWVMNPDGSNRRYLGNAGNLQKEYDALREQEAWSPDGRYRSYTYQSHADKFPQIYIQGKDKDQFGNLPTWEVTHLSKTTYDPVWSPDGSRLAFVSQETGSDDIFTIDPQGGNIWQRTKNPWQWDKHPSWAPDGQRLVFWSNRDNAKNLFVMQVSGNSPVTNISRVAWDEYDPIWIK